MVKICSAIGDLRVVMGDVWPAIGESIHTICEIYFVIFYFRPAICEISSVIGDLRPVILEVSS